MAERSSFFARQGKTVALAIAKMADLFSWTDLARSLLSLTRYLPNGVLRWGWSPKKLLSRIEAFHFDQAPRFCVSAQRDTPAFEYSGFNIFNFTPFKLAIVAAEMRVSLGLRELIKYDEPFTRESELLPYQRGGFYVSRELNERQVARVRECAGDCVAFRVAGWMVLRTPLGQLRKELQADVVAVIDRGDLLSGSL